MKRILSLILVLALTLFGATASSILTPKGFEGGLWDGTLALYGTLDKTTHFLCTAEPIAKIEGGYRLLSAGHCVQEPPAGVQFSVAENIGAPRTNVTMVKAYMGDEIDFAIFDLKTTKVYPVFVLGDERDARVGDRIVNPNFARAIGKQLSYGTVSSDIISDTGGLCTVKDCSGLFMVQMYGAGGSSGSAVLSEKTHKVIGLTIYGFGDVVGLGVEPISKFATFMAGPNQPHPVTAPEEEDQGEVSGH